MVYLAQKNRGTVFAFFHHTIRKQLGKSLATIVEPDVARTTVYYWMFLSVYKQKTTSNVEYHLAFTQLPALAETKQKRTGNKETSATKDAFLDLPPLVGF